MNICYRCFSGSTLVSGQKLRSTYRPRLCFQRRLTLSEVSRKENVVASIQKSTEEASKVDSSDQKGPSGLPPELSMFIVAAFWGSNPVCLRYAWHSTTGQLAT